MSSDLNKIIIIGRLTSDVTLKTTPKGKLVGGFSIANNRTYITGNEKKEQASFFNCVIWDKAGEIFSQYCKKGHRVAIEGRLQQRKWKDKEGKNNSIIEIIVESFQFLESKKSESNSVKKNISDNINETDPDIDNIFSIDEELF